MVKSIPENIIADLVRLINSSEFYNKIQITFDYQEFSFKTETFYFFENIIGHSIMEQKDGKVEVVEETKEYTVTDELRTRLQALPDDSKVIVAGNSGDSILTVKLM